MLEVLYPQENLTIVKSCQITCVLLRNKRQKIELQEYDRQCILLIAICDKKQLSNFALRYDKRKANRG